VTEYRYSAGEVIFAEGAPTDYVYLLKDGTVELVRQMPNGPLIIALLRTGALFGEFGLDEATTRQVTARALGPVAVEAIPRRAFSAAFKSLFAAGEAVPTMPHIELPPEAAVEAKPENSGRARQASYAALRLVADSAYLGPQMPKDGVVVTEMPFRIGRESTRGESGPPLATHLSFADEEPFQLSRVHFAIDDAALGPMVVDCGSRLGTLVNGQPIGNRAEDMHAPLNRGENLVVAGGSSSPFRFKVIVEPARG
jgi:hypothetical protein